MDKMTPKSNADIDQPKAGPDTQGILVLGMHRSGTSACTRVLNLLGCSLSNNLLGAGDGNESGHWEAIDAVALNDEILASAGSSHDDWGPINPDWRKSAIRSHLIGRAKQIVANHLEIGPLFAIKDPRICRLADVWIQATIDAGSEPLVLMMLRNPAEVAASLEARDLMAAGYAELLWLRHVLDAEYLSRGQKRVVCHYDELMRDWRSLVGKISSGLGVSFPSNSPRTHTAIDRFLTPKLRHHQVDSNDLIGNPAYSQWLRTAYRVLRGWSETGEDSADYPMLDELRAELDRAYDAFAKLLFSPELVGAPGIAGQLRRDLATTKEQAQNSAQALQQSQDIIERLRADAEQHEVERAAQREAEAANAVALRTEIEKLEAELAASVEASIAEVQRLEAELTEKNELLASVRAALEVAEQANASELQRREQAESRLLETSSEMQDQLLLNAELTGQVSALQSTVSQRQEEIAQLYERLNEARHAQALIEAAHESERQRRIEQETRAAAAEAKAEDEIRSLKIRLADEQLSASLRADELTSDLAKLTIILSQQEKAAEALLEELKQTKGEAHDLSEKMQTLTKTADSAESARREAEGRLSARFSELAQITAIAAQESEQARRLKDEADWLREVRRVEEGFPAWWSIMPTAWQRSRQHRRFYQAGLFDAATYLDLYPDVAAQGMDPLRHYVLHGMAEGRTRTVPN